MNLKKYNKKLLIAAIIAAILLAGLEVGIILLKKPTAFNGSRVANPDSFLLTFTAMNQSDSHSLHLENGDTLRVSCIVEKGKIDVEIQAEGQQPIYRGNGMQTASFDLPISEAGDYAIRVDARNAAGALEFQAVKP